MAGLSTLNTNQDKPATNININTEHQLIAYAFYRKKNGRAEETYYNEIRKLRQIAKICNLNEPEEVKTIISELKWKNSTKNQFCTIYNEYIKLLNITWQKPKYRTEETLPFIPLEQEIDQLTASCQKRLATLLQTLKETGARVGEATKLKWLDIDIQRKTVNIHPEKGSNARILPISDKLINMLGELKRKEETIFSTCIHSIRTNYCAQRNRTASKLGNPRIKKITFHTLRHFKGTMEYHKTKDIVHVKYVLGHKNIKNTMIYINLEQALFLTENDEWITKVAKTIEEAQPLIEAGFTEATDYNGIKIFKKRK